MAQVNRYSTIVTWVKVTLPILGVILLSSLFLFSRSPDPDAALPFAEMDVEQIARDQRLSQPRFAGTLDDGREVTLVAETAMPSTETANIILLDRVEARMELSSTDFLLLNAQAGRVDMATQLADLRGNVRVVTSQGYRLASDTMQIALAELRLVAPGPVTASGPGFDLEAGAMELTGPDAEAVLSFTGGVRLLYGSGE